MLILVFEIAALRQNVYANGAGGESGNEQRRTKFFGAGNEWTRSAGISRRRYRRRTRWTIYRMASHRQGRRRLQGHDLRGHRPPRRQDRDRRLPGRWFV